MTPNEKRLAELIEFAQDAQRTGEFLSSALAHLVTMSEAVLADTKARDELVDEIDRAVAAYRADSKSPGGASPSRILRAAGRIADARKEGIL